MDPIEASTQLGHMTFIDVRESYEYDAGHVEGAIHIPIGQIQERAEALPNERPVVVTCQIGQRSRLVADHLRERGFDAHNLEGGLEAWVAAGLPLVADTAAGQVVDGWARDLSGRRLSRES